MARPRLILVSGPPGSGKTTLAREIGRQMPCPVVARDDVKEGLMWASSDATPEMGAPIAALAFDVFFRLIAEHLGAGCSLVAEAAFRNDFEHDLHLVANLADARHVQCRIDRSEAARRFVQRANGDAALRHAHPDREIATSMANGTFEWERYETLDLKVPTMTVDTTTSYRPSLAEIVAFSRAR